MNYDAILESISDGVFTVDVNWRITYLNRSAEKIIRIKREDAIGRLCCEVFRSNLCEGACALRRTLENHQPIVDLACYIINNLGHKIPVSISTAVLRDSQGKIVGGAETFRNLSDIEQLKKALQPTGQLGDYSSHSPAMRSIMEQLPAVADTTSTVLITGETGSGKDLLARTIHQASARKKQPFVAINCGAFPETLLESELFGYKKGAFTGADRDKPGRFAAAEGGTLFLDEIGEITQPMQIRLLRVLQERSYEPLGAVQPVASDVRIICATHRDLKKLVAQGKFRQDLFYRINVIHLELPPLRERREDLPFLIDTFIRRFNLRMSKQVSGVSNSVLKKLNQYTWPGNIRELENLIERSLVFCKKEVIELEDLPPELNDSASPVANAALPSGIAAAQRSAQAQTIYNALRQTGGNRQQAARLLGVHYTTLYRKLKTLDWAKEFKDGRFGQSSEKN